MAEMVDARARLCRTPRAFAFSIAAAAYALLGRGVGELGGPRSEEEACGVVLSSVVMLGE